MSRLALNWAMLSEASIALLELKAHRRGLAASDLGPQARDGEIQFWDRVSNCGLGKILHSAVLALRNRRALWRLYRAAPTTALGRFVRARPECWRMIIVPYVSARWSPEERLTRLADHCRTVERLGPLLDFHPQACVTLLTLDEFDRSYRIVIDQPSWLLRDGQMAFSLWEGRDRLFSLSFCLSSDSGRLIAYVGGVQGRREDGVLERYRTLTKRAHGMRPNDLIVELFRQFASSLGVTQIFAVSDRTRHQQSRYSLANPGWDLVTMRYDELWNARGAHLRDDGLFDLPLSSARRSPAEIKPNKRTMYRRRYAALDMIAERLREVVRRGLSDDMLGWHGAEPG